MRTEAYDAYDAYDSDGYEAYDSYGERWRPPANMRRRPQNYAPPSGPSAAAGGAAQWVSKTELQLALAPVARDIATANEAVTSLGKRVEAALIKIDKDTTAARRDMGSAKRNVQSAQMMALLPFLMQNSTPPQLSETQTGLRIQIQNAQGQPIDLSGDPSTLPQRLQGATPVVIDDSGKPAKVLTDVEYGALAQQALGGNSNMMLILVMMMMMGGFGGGDSQAREFGGSDNNMMMMLLLVMMMRQPGAAPQTQPVRS